MSSTATPPVTTTPLPADVNSDGSVDEVDLLDLIDGIVSSGDQYDLNQDHANDYADVFLFTIFWGEEPKD